MNLATGSLLVCLRAEQVLECRLQRPLQAVGELLLRQSPALACDQLPLLFSVCGHAHRLAGRLACGLWRLHHPDDQAQLRQAVRELIVEQLRERMLHLIRDWQLPLSVRVLPAWLAALAAGQPVTALVSDTELALWRAQLQRDWQPLEGLQMPALGGNWQAFGPDQASPQQAFAGSAARRLAATGGQPLTEVLLQIAGDAWLECQRGINWLQSHDAPLSDWLVLRSRCDDLSITRQGWVLTSRGWLCHEIKNEAGQRDWQILAPTDVNFGGDLLASLMAVDTRDSQQRQTLLSWLLRALDPCLAVTIHRGEGEAADA